jgi:IPT/TIG domain
MSSPIARLLLLVCAALAVVPATAGAATKTSIPKVSSVTPMKLKIGDRLTIKGSGFLKGKNRNTVVFKASGQRAVFVKAESGTSTRLVVKVPAKLLTFLKVSGGSSVATRFQLRVLARKLSKSYTSAGASPVIAPAVTTKSTGSTPGPSSKGGSSATTTAAADCDSDGTADAADTDDDNDLLLDSTENAIGTYACAADSDADGMTDGWEYKSAVDLKQRSCPGVTDYPTPCAAAKPYPSGRPYPNPLDGSDGAQDYDGDSLPAYLEFTAWKKKAAADAAWRNINNLWYSEGLQASQDTSAATGCRGMEVPQPFNGNGVREEFARPTTPVTYPDVTQSQYRVYSLDNVGRHAYDGCLDDAERDEDGDFLNNSSETVGGMSGLDYWRGNYTDEQNYKVLYAGTDWMDADTDDDGTVDGLDDQDHDDFLNVEEVYRGTVSRTEDDKDSGVRTGLWVQPYNPCLPSPNSRTCPASLILSQPAWRPFAKDENDVPLPRWPLYGVINGSGVGDDISDVVWDPHDVDPAALEAAQQIDPDVDPETLPDITSPELWSPPFVLTQSMPALHPVPRSF